jgi:hypothetical protein
VPSVFERPAERLVTGLLRAVTPTQRLRRARVDAVYADGTVQVEGAKIPTVRGLTPRAGQIVWVADRDGQPTLVVKLAARPSRRHHPVTPTALPIVEELLIVPNVEAGGEVDVWWRNHDQVAPLGVRQQMTADPVAVRWGQDRNAFVVQTGQDGDALDDRYVYWVFELDRTPTEVLQPGLTPAATLHHVERPLDQELELFRVIYTKTATGTTYFSKFLFDSNLGVFYDAQTIQGALEISGQATRVYRLDHEAVDGTQAGRLYQGHNSPNDLERYHVFILDAYLTQDLELILVVRLQTGNLLGPTYSLDIEHGYDSMTVQDPTLACSGMTLPETVSFRTVPEQPDIPNVNIRRENHLFVVNATSGQVLYRTTPAVLTLHQEQAQSTAGTVFRVVIETETQTPFCGILLPTNSVGTPDQTLEYDLGTVGTLARRNDFWDLTVPYVANDMYATVDSLSDQTTRYQDAGRFVAVRRIQTLRAVNQVRRYHVIDARVVTWSRDPAERRLWVWQRREHDINPVNGIAPNYAVQYRLLLLNGVGQVVRELEPYRTEFYQHPDNFTELADIRLLGTTGVHLLYYTKSHGAAATANNQITVESTLTQVVLVDMTTGARRVVGDDLEEFLDHDFRMLRPDFLYAVIDDEPDDGGLFVKGWESDGAPTLDQAAEDYPPPDEDLEGLGRLAEVPEAVELIAPPEIWSNPSNHASLTSDDRIRLRHQLAVLSYQAVNDPDVLGVLAVDDPGLG